VRIAIDAHTVGTKLGGNESYAVNLIEALAAIDSANQYTIYITTNEARERFSNRWPNFKVRSTLPHTPLIRIPLTLSAELRKNPVDVLHVQFTAPPFCPVPGRRKHSRSLVRALTADFQSSQPNAVETDSAAFCPTCGANSFALGTHTTRHHRNL
jgi:hypothetical protein